MGSSDNVDEAYFFPTERRIMKYAPYRKVMLDGGRIQISTEQHRRFSQDLTEFEGTLKAIDDNGVWRAFDIRPERSDIAWDHSIEVELISETSNIAPGETIWSFRGSIQLTSGIHTGKWEEIAESRHA